MAGEPTVIYSAATTQQAYLLKGLLEDRGITARVVNDAIQIAGGDLPLGWAAAARVVVGADEAVAARQLAEEFDRQTAHEPADDDLAADDADEWTDWPLCPECSERRSARCENCGASGTKFRLAEIDESVAGQCIFLVCDNCDDHVSPQWYRLCPRCGHDFGAGVEADASSKQLPRLSGGEWLVIGLLALGGLVLGAYFVWLFGGRGG